MFADCSIAGEIAAINNPGIRSECEPSEHQEYNSRIIHRVLFSEQEKAGRREEAMFR